LPASSFSSHATRLVPLAFVALTAVFAPSCRSLEIWGRNAQEMKRLLESGDHAFLRKVDFSRDNPDEALQLREGAPYLLGVAFQGLGLDSQAARLYRLQVVQGDSPWNALAMPPLLAILIRGEDYDTARRLALEHLAAAPDPINRDLIRKGLVEALYWSRDDTATLQGLNAYFPTGRSADNPEINAELALFKAVASTRLGVENWPDLVVALCITYPASAVHMRAQQFFARDDAMRAALPPLARALLEAKASLAAGQPAKALAPLEAAIGGLGGLLGEPLMREAVAAFGATGDPMRGARAFERAGAGATGPARLAAMEGAARLYRAAGALADAARAFATLAEATSDPAQRDRAAWFLAELAGRGSTRAAVAEVGRSHGQWRDPLFFDDLVDDLTTRLLGDNDREGLRLLYGAIGDLEIPTRLRLRYILYRLGVPNVPPLEPLLSGRTTTVMEDYYRLLLDPASRPAAEPSPEPARGDLDFLMTGLLEFGLNDQAMSLARKAGPALSRAARITASRTLVARQRYKDAISLVGNGYPWEYPRDERRGEIAQVAYPEAFEREIRQIARRDKVEDRLLFAVAREESAFDPAIVSSAGAVGLTQLIPATADEEARRMRLASYNLLAAPDNLSIGFHYLARLIKLQESVPFGLAAYNAGLTRVRAWKQQFAHLPPDLVLEAIPYEETRHYVRKVLVSAATYGTLYEGLAPVRTVELFYPPVPRP
jgi:soluble lytic murein transglycosylase